MKILINMNGKYSQAVNFKAAFQKQISGPINTQKNK